MNEQVLKTNDDNLIEKKIQEWIERGEKIIYPDNFDDWKSCVKNRASDYYRGFDLEYALETLGMQRLNPSQIFYIEYIG